MDSLTFNDIMPSRGGDDEKQPFNPNHEKQDIPNTFVEPVRAVKAKTNVPIDLIVKTKVDERNNRSEKSERNDRNDKRSKGDRRNRNNDVGENVKRDDKISNVSNDFVPVDSTNALTAQPAQQVYYNDDPIKLEYVIPRTEVRNIIYGQNPYQNIGRLNFFYEDKIPEELMYSTSINDRLNLAKYMSKNIFNIFEQESDKKFYGYAEKHIVEGLEKHYNFGLSKLYSKIYSLYENPNFDDKPEDRPKYFRIFNSCYPIVKTENGVACSKMSKNINLRLYKTPLILKDEYIKKDNREAKAIKEEDKKEDFLKFVEDTDFNKTHIGRELNYLDYVNSIIESKESPNFPICYGSIRNLYDENINFNNAVKLTTISQSIKTTNPIDEQFKFIIDYIESRLTFIVSTKKELSDKSKENIDKIIKILKDVMLSYEDIERSSVSSSEKQETRMFYVNFYRKFAKELANFINNKEYNEWKHNYDQTQQEKEGNIVKYETNDDNKYIIETRKFSNVVSFALSEAPELSFKEWTNPKIVKDVGIAKMLETGWHSEEEMNIVYFQVLYNFIVMLKHKIYIPNFSKDNIFIKKTSPGMINKLFVYNVDGIKYYIPNKGSQVIIDERYAGMTRGAIKDDTTYEKYIYAVEGNNVGVDNISFGDDTSDDKLKEMFANMVKIINDELKSNDVNAIVDGDNIQQQCIDRIRELIINRFTMFANNRCGSILGADEYRAISGEFKPLIDYECGELALMSTDNDSRFKVVMIVSRPNIESNNVKIQTLDANNKMIIVDCDIADLVELKNNNLITQFKDKYIRVEDNIIESYYLITDVNM